MNHVQLIYPESLKRLRSESHTHLIKSLSLVLILSESCTIEKLIYSEGLFVIFIYVSFSILNESRLEKSVMGEKRKLLSSQLGTSALLMNVSNVSGH